MNYFRLKWTLQVSVRSGLETREVKHWAISSKWQKETFPRKFVLIKMRFLDISSSSKIIFFFNYFLIASALGNFSVVCAKICKFRANYWTMSRFRSLSRSQFKRCVNSLPKVNRAKLPRNVFVTFSAAISPLPSIIVIFVIKVQKKFGTGFYEILIGAHSIALDEARVAPVITNLMLFLVR